MQDYCPDVVEKTVSPLPAPGAAPGRCAVAREVKPPMTSLPAGSVLPELNTRGSTHINAPGLFVLSLGSLVLLTGLAPPEPAVHDLVALATSAAPGGSSLPWWLAGATVCGIGLAVIQLLRRVKSPFLPLLAWV